jgi:hypothetical protein
LTKEWFMLLLVYCLALLFKIWQRRGSCGCCYIFYHYYSTFDRGVFHVVVVIFSTITVKGWTEEWLMLLYFLPLLFKVWLEWFILLFYCLPLLFMVWERSGSCSDCYNVYHYCLRFDRGVVHVVVILSTITV